MPKRFFVNNQIKAEKVRVVSEDGKQLGVFEINEALKIAREKGLDLIKVTDKVWPPVCRLADYGKFIYQEKKKEKQKNQNKGGELKNLRLRFNISEHDLATRIKSAEKFLKKGYKVRIEMVLRGREKALSGYARERLEKFLETLKEIIPFNIERDIKREGRGITAIITKA